MYDIILMVFIFVVVLFCYVHIYYHYKTSNDLEVYDLDNVTKDKLEEICNLKQPFIMNYNETIIEHTNLYTIEPHYNAFEINIRNNTNNKQNNDENKEEEDSVPLILEKAKELFTKKKQTNDNSNNNNNNETNDSVENQPVTYFTEDNMDFLTESGIIKHIKYNDGYLRPSMVSNCFYDVISGSVDGYTPLRYDVNNRNYYLVTNGYIEVILIPPKYSKYVYAESNYEMFEFKSPVNVWNVQEMYKQE